MLITRLWVGSLLILLTVGVLLGDQYLPPYYPFLFVVILGLTLAACRELLAMLDAAVRPPALLCYGGCAALTLSNWWPHLLPLGQPWPWIAGTFAAFILSVFLVEMARFREPGSSVPRMSLAVWVVAYVGILPSFLAQVRWLHIGPAQGAAQGAVALALAIFVPKSCDIGAYCTGRLIGRHRMTPVLSPKKTWEGAAGGLVLASGVAVAIDRLASFAPLKEELWAEIGFGLSVGLAGMLGDLAESLIKRDCQKKDAAQTIPGFGGVLDVVDALLFAGPMVYAWLVLLR